MSTEAPIQEKVPSEFVPASKGLLINRNFAQLAIGQAISNIGDFVYSTTLLVWVFVLTHSAAAVSFSIDGRIFINDDGHYNFPGGEFFTGPVEDSANGYIRYSFPASFGGRSVEDVRLRFESGVVVEATAAQGQDYLDKMLAMDEGARRLGEFAFGNNRNVDRCTKNTLFDEKMGGTVHLALGASIPETRGVNQSALHWDMVCDLRSGSEVRVDGQLFCKDGEFVV